MTRIPTNGVPKMLIFAVLLAICCEVAAFSCTSAARDTSCEAYLRCMPPVVQTPQCNGLVCLTSDHISPLGRTNPWIAVPVILTLALSGVLSLALLMLWTGLPQLVFRHMIWNEQSGKNRFHQCEDPEASGQTKGSRRLKLNFQLRDYILGGYWPSRLPTSLNPRLFTKPFKRLLIWRAWIQFKWLNKPDGVYFKKVDGDLKFSHEHYMKDIKRDLHTLADCHSHHRRDTESQDDNDKKTSPLDKRLQEVTSNDDKVTDIESELKVITDPVIHKLIHDFRALKVLEKAIKIARGVKDRLQSTPSDDDLDAGIEDDENVATLEDATAIDVKAKETKFEKLDVTKDLKYKEAVKGTMTKVMEVTTSTGQSTSFHYASGPTQAPKNPNAAAPKMCNMFPAPRRYRRHVQLAPPIFPHPRAMQQQPTTHGPMNINGQFTTTTARAFLQIASSGALRIFVPRVLVPAFNQGRHSLFMGSRRVE